MRVVKGIVLLQTGAEMSQSSSTKRFREKKDSEPTPEIGSAKGGLSLDPWPEAKRGPREDSASGAADSDCEDWT